MLINTLHNWQINDYNTLLSFRNRLSNAILIQGQDRTEVNNLAVNFIASFCCEKLNYNDIACGSCRGCSLLKDNSHPDLFILKNDKDSKSKNITIDLVREMIEFVSLGTHLIDRKVVFIEDVNALNQSSSNALLKILEESPLYALFIIAADNMSKVLPTIKSRCYKFIIKPKRVDEFADSTNLWVLYYENPLPEVEISSEQLEILLNVMIKPSVDNIFKCAEVFYSEGVRFGFVLEFIYRWLTEITTYNLAGTLSIFCSYEENIKHLVNKVSYKHLFYLSDWIIFLLGWANHPLNYKLQIENVLFSYQQLFA